LAAPSPGGPNGAETRRLALAIVEELGKMDALRSTATVFVLLPSPWNYHNEADRTWRGALRMEMTRRGLHYVDVIEDFDALTETRLKSMFFPKDHPGFGHFTPSGNRFVAEILYETVVKAIADTNQHSIVTP
jgi:hypothetical protein